jgi:altronate dehydratase large subunit
MMRFEGYRRPDGQAGTRNHVLVIPSVGCSQTAAQAIVRGWKGAVYLSNIMGCGQVGDDRDIIKRTLIGFGAHPNVYAVLVVGNGCEELTAGIVAEGIRPTGKRVEFMTIQEIGGVRKAVALGRRIVKEMLRDASALSRMPVPLSELILGTECGGSDFTSGLASNPSLGAAADMLCREGGTVLLSETPELIGAEHILARRAVMPEIGEQVLNAVAWWEGRCIAHGQDIRDSDPSPGNKEGGLTTLEEKSLGCIYKAGTGPLQEVIAYACRPTKKGLVHMDTPAHDIEQLTGMVAGGAQIAVFTTGRGTPVGSPIVPVIKITGNRDTYLRMRDMIDVDASAVLRGKQTIETTGERLLAEIAAVASGKITKAEKLGQRDFAVFRANASI